MVPNPSLLWYYGRLERILKDIALRLKLILTLEFFLRLATVFILILLGNLFVEEGKVLFPFLPFIYSVLSWAVLVWVLQQGLRRATSRLTLQRVAGGLEEKIPLLRDDVTNSLLLFHQIKEKAGTDNISEGLVTAHLQKTAAAVSTIRPGQVVSYKKVLSHLKLVIPLGLAFMAVAALDSQFLSRSTAAVFKPFTVLPLRETLITLEKVPAVVLRGTSLLIRARTTGHVPEELALMLRPENGKEIRFEMMPAGNGTFSYRLASVQSSFRYQAVSDRSASTEHPVRVVDVPEISDLQLTLLPPAYTGFPRETVAGGHIEALKGTVVNLQARVNKPIREGTLTLNLKNQLPLHIEGDRLDATLLVFYPGAYSLSIKDEFGFENADPVAYRIGVIPDKYPEAEIVSPAEALPVSGKEVLPLIYNLRDDFGVTRVRLIYQLGGIEQSIPLKNPKGGRSTGLLRFDWDLAAMALTPGDRITYRLEVWDNDSVSGPKAGYSRTNTLYLRDDARELERAQSIWAALLDLLADHLEETRDPKSLSQELARIMTDVDHYLERMGREQVERYDLESLKRNMAALERKIDELPKEKITQELERLALLAEDLLKKARMEEVEALSREIKNRQTRFVDALRDQKGPLTPGALEGLLKELEKLKDLTAQVMEALSRMATQLPDEFINSPDLQGLNFQDLFSDLNEIQQKLMAGDLKGALEAAQRLLQNLSEMMAAMARAGAQSRMGSFDRLQSEMSRQTSELEKIVEEQKEILAGTEAVVQELSGSLEAETENRLEQMSPAIQLTLDQLHGLLSSEQREVVAEMKKLLEESEIEKLSELSDNLAEELKDNLPARKVAVDLRRAINGLTPAPTEAMKSELGDEFSRLSARQEKLHERTGGLGNMLETLSQLFPGMDSEIIHDIKTAAGAMGQATAKLKQADAPGAVPPEEAAIRSLTRSQQSMQQMARQMAQQMARQMQASRWGYPLGYDPRAGWYYGPWGNLPTLPQPEVKQRRERGYTGIDKEEFDPPAKDAYKTPQALREKVLEALKEDIPPPYRREVQKYFKGLTE
ncbi:MAG: DUF4175 family protein [Thermodesulfobacteriota bacterium]